MTWTVAGINFAHFHMGDQLGYVVDNPDTELVAICDEDPERATLALETTAEQFDLDDDQVYRDHERCLSENDVDLVVTCPVPTEHADWVENFAEYDVHVLSQKPFATDLDDAERLVELADEHGVKLAVNQNGRWAPHFSYIRHAVADGLIGDVHGLTCNVHWDHNWIEETPLDDVEHIVLYDFAIHWFDQVTQLVEETPAQVFASYEPSPSQTASPPLLGSAVVEFEGAQATLTFDADTKLGPEDRTIVTGGAGTIQSEGPDLEDQDVTVYTEDGYASPDLEGTWFPDGFHGAMAELLRAIEADREPAHSGRDNLATLELTYAAVASAEDGEPKRTGDVRRLPEGAG